MNFHGYILRAIGVLALFYSLTLPALQGIYLLLIAIYFEIAANAERKVKVEVKEKEQKTTKQQNEITKEQNTTKQNDRDEFLNNNGLF